METVAIRWKLRDRRNPGEAVLTRVVIGKMPLMSVGHQLAAAAELVAPREELPGEAAARGKLPFRFSRQALSCPLRVRSRIRIGDVHHGKPLLALD
jgi:hypothetical protein